MAAFLFKAQPVRFGEVFQENDSAVDSLNEEAESVHLEIVREKGKRPAVRSVGEGERLLLKEDDMSGALAP